jgi:hypothetical protein
VLSNLPLVVADKYILYEDFSLYPDSSVLNGMTPRHGPRWATTGASLPTTSGGYLVNSGTGYLYTNLPGRPQVIGCKIAFSGGTDMNAKTGALCMSSQMPGTLAIKNLFHYNFGPNGFNMGVFDAAGAFTNVYSANFAAPMNNTGTLYDTWFGLVGDTMMVGGPNGELFAMTDSRWAPQWGNLVFWEPVTAADGLTPKMRTAYAIGRKALVVKSTTFNPADKSATMALSNGNLTGTSSGANGQVRSIAPRSNGKVHVEFTIVKHTTATAENLALGIASLAEHVFTQGVGANLKSVAVWPRGATTNIYLNNAGTNLGTMSGATGKVWAVEVDLDNLKFWAKNVTDATGWNNGAIGVQNPATNLGGVSLATLSGAPYCICVEADVNTDAITVNTDAKTFVEPMSAGFGPWL